MGRRRCGGCRCHRPFQRSGANVLPGWRLGRCSGSVGPGASGLCRRLRWRCCAGARLAAATRRRGPAAVHPQLRGQRPPGPNGAPRGQPWRAACVGRSAWPHQALTADIGLSIAHPCGPAGATAAAAPNATTAGWEGAGAAATTRGGLLGSHRSHRSHGCRRTSDRCPSAAQGGGAGSSSGGRRPRQRWNRGCRGRRSCGRQRLSRGRSARPRRPGRAWVLGGNSGRSGRSVGCQRQPRACGSTLWPRPAAPQPQPTPAEAWALVVVVVRS